MGAGPAPEPIPDRASVDAEKVSATRAAVLDRLAIDDTPANCPPTPMWLIFRDIAMESAQCWAPG